VTKVLFRPDRTLLAVVIVMVVAALPLALTAAWLLPVLLMPVALLVWVLRARVEADPTSLVVCNGLARSTMAWDDVRGFHVPRRGPVRLLLEGQRSLPLTTVTRRDLPRLLEVGKPS